MQMDNIVLVQLMQLNMDLVRYLKKDIFIDHGWMEQILRPQVKP